MPAEIRPITAEEMEDYVRLDAYAFGYVATPEVLARYRGWYRTEWTLATFLDGRMVAHLVAVPMPMMVGGAAVPMAGIADVAVWPEDRRAGHAGTLLRRCIATMHDNGHALSMLYPTFYALYRRFGWALAAESRHYRFRPASLHLLPSLPPESGRLERLAEGAVPVLAEVYARWLRTSNGALVRDEAQWHGHTMVSGREGPPLQAVLWRDPDGQPRSYVLHRYPQEPADGSRRQELGVKELIAETPEAYRALLGYLVRHDLVHVVRLEAPVDDPLPAMLADPTTLESETRPSFMLRIVDLVPALEQRGYAPGPPARLVLRVTDPAAPWNDGAWFLDVAQGKARVTATHAAPGLATDIATLAALYMDYLAPARAR